MAGKNEETVPAAEPFFEYKPPDEAVKQKTVEAACHINRSISSLIKHFHSLPKCTQTEYKRKKNIIEKAYQSVSSLAKPEHRADNSSQQSCQHVPHPISEATRRPLVPPSFTQEAPVSKQTSEATSRVSKQFQDDAGDHLDNRHINIKPGHHPDKGEQSFQGFHPLCESTPTEYHSHRKKRTIEEANQSVSSLAKPEHRADNSSKQSFQDVPYPICDPNPFPSLSSFRQEELMYNQTSEAIRKVIKKAQDKEGDNLAKALTPMEMHEVSNKTTNASVAISGYVLATFYYTTQCVIPLPRESSMAKLAIATGVITFFLVLPRGVYLYLNHNTPKRKRQSRGKTIEAANQSVSSLAKPEHRADNSSQQTFQHVPDPIFEATRRSLVPPSFTREAPVSKQTSEARVSKQVQDKEGDHQALTALERHDARMKTTNSSVAMSTYIATSCYYTARYAIHLPIKSLMVKIAIAIVVVIIFQLLARGGFYHYQSRNTRSWNKAMKRVSKQDKDGKGGQQAITALGRFAANMKTTHTSLVISTYVLLTCYYTTQIVIQLPIRSLMVKNAIGMLVIIIFQVLARGIYLYHSRNIPK